MFIPSRQKSTGKRSENNHFWGHVADVMTQLLMAREMRRHVAYAILEIEAEGLDDWPRDGGKPKGWSKANGDDAQLAIERAHHFADYYGLWLMEYDDGKPPVARRVYYGGMG
jgi:hypothetical protein